MDIQCSNCGATMCFVYGVGHVMGAIRAGWDSYGSALYCPVCTATWNERNKGRKLAGPEHTIDVINGMYIRQSCEGIDRGEEFTYMAQFAARNSFDGELSRERLRTMWTAYCFHHGLKEDTAEYEDDLARLWDVVSKSEGGTSGWPDLDSFDRSMSRYLV